MDDQNQPWVQSVEKVRAYLAHVVMDANSTPESAKLASDALRRAADDLLPHNLSAGPSMRSIGDLVDGALARAMARAEGREIPVPLPWPELSRIYRGGLWPGMHLVVAGTGAGKTQFALQIAANAAKQGIGVGYVGLELDELQVTLRLASLLDGVVPWSDWYTGCRDEHGRVNREQLERLPKALDAIRPFPIKLDFAAPNGWPASRLASVVREVRAAHPDQSKPVLVVLDFLQLVSDEPGDRGVELKERIGRAAYVARQVAAEQNAAILLISSTARINYMSGEQACGVARAVQDEWNALHNPDAIVGLGKESGETEYAADSVAVLARMTDLPDGRSGSVVLVAVPKVRAGRARWDVLRFNGHRFESMEGARRGEASEQDAAYAHVQRLQADREKKSKGSRRNTESDTPSTPTAEPARASGVQKATKGGKRPGGGLQRIMRRESVNEPPYDPTPDENDA